MSPLLTKLLQPLTGSTRQVGLYLADDAIALCDLGQSQNESVQTEVDDVSDSLKSLLSAQQLAADQQAHATVALGSREFNTYVLNFAELPDKPAAQEALIRWTLQQRKLLGKDDDDNQLRFQVMGQTKKGIKVLVEIMHGDRHAQINMMLGNTGVLPGTICRAGHYIFNSLVNSDQHEVPAALVFIEQDMVSAYFWSEQGILTYYRDYSLHQAPAIDQSDVATDVISIIRRLENTEWAMPATCVYVASSRFSKASSNAMVQHLAAHCDVQVVGNHSGGMLQLVQGAAT